MTGDYSYNCNYVGTHNIESHSGFARTKISASTASVILESRIRKHIDDESLVFVFILLTVSCS